MGCSPQPPFGKGCVTLPSAWDDNVAFAVREPRTCDVAVVGEEAFGTGEYVVVSGDPGVCAAEGVSYTGVRGVLWCG